MDKPKDWIKEFLEIMASATISVDQIDSAMRLKHQNLPKSIFKFRAFNTQNEYALNNLKTDTVWICTPSEYNDPYDCSITFSTERLLKEQSKKNIDKWISQSGIKNSLSAEQIEAIKSADDPLVAMIPMVTKLDKSTIQPDANEKLALVFSEFSKKQNKEMVERFNEGLQGRMGVCSFSETNESIVMWGHYSGNHTGFCVEYDLSQLPSNDMRLRILFPVVYAKDLFDASKYFLQATQGGSYNNLFNIVAAMHKAPEWAYEREWRFIHSFEKSLLNTNYPMPTPKAVYLGSRISSENKAKVTEIASARKIPVRQMRLSEKEFKLVPEPA